MEVLRNLGFGHRRCNMLSSLLSSTTTQVFLNGEPGEVIYHRWGL
uniref:Uncharacterized protein n=1 Tax=Arundo donax TaxID=35708 RepID=A0A0A9CPS5_ARUDO